MNSKVYVLAIAAFVVGMVELMIGGILPLIVEDLQVSVAKAGQLISVFALVFAVSGPVLLTLTSRVERKRLYLVSLFMFFLGTLLAYFSETYAVLMASRVFSAMSASLIIVLSITIAVRIVPEAYRARALGLVFMGVSSALVLGVPLGVLVGNAYGWRVLFLGIAVLTLVAFVIVWALLEELEAGEVVSIGQQVRALRSTKIVSIHGMMMLVLAGHYTMYAYLAAFLETTMSFSARWVSAGYLVFGFAAILGGYLGGFFSDRLGPRKAMLWMVAVFAAVLFLLPFSTKVPVMLWLFIFLWGALSWMIAPAQQSYLIEVAPETSDIQQSLSTSSLQVGIALGSAIGGLALDVTGTVAMNAWVGSAVVVLAFGCAWYSITRVQGGDVDGVDGVSEVHL